MVNQKVAARLQVGPNCLLFLIDETGHETFADKHYPVFEQHFGGAAAQINGKMISVEISAIHVSRKQMPPRLGCFIVFLKKTRWTDPNQIARATAINSIISIWRKSRESDSTAPPARPTPRPVLCSRLQSPVYQTETL
jgi:hypothetical protein